MSSHENWVPRKRESHEQLPQMEGGMHTRFAHINDDDENDSLNENASDEEMLRVIGDETGESRDRNPQANQVEQRKRKRSEFDAYAGSYSIFNQFFLWSGWLGGVDLLARVLID